MDPLSGALKIKKGEMLLNTFTQNLLLCLDAIQKERPCFTLATMIRLLFNVFERSFWPEGTETKN